jgi:hypothetical protein
MTFSQALLKQAAKRLARETGFTRAEIRDMRYSEMVWWLTD